MEAQPGEENVGGLIAAHKAVPTIQRTRLLPFVYVFVLIDKKYLQKTFYVVIRCSKIIKFSIPRGDCVTFFEYRIEEDEHLILIAKMGLAESNHHKLFLKDIEHFVFIARTG